MRKVVIYGKYSWETIPQAIARQEGLYVDPETGRKLVYRWSKDENRNLKENYIDIATGEVFENRPPKAEFVDNSNIIDRKGEECLHYYHIYKEYVIEEFFWHYLREHNGGQMDLDIHPEVSAEAMKELLHHLKTLCAMKEKGEDPTEYIHENLHYGPGDNGDVESEINYLMGRIENCTEYLETVVRRGYDSYFIEDFD